MKPETLKRKEEEKETKYKAILDAAEAVMGEEGLTALSINKVARKARIAKGTVYLYFASKEEIIGGLTIRARKSLLDYLQFYCDQKLEPLDRIKGVFWANYYFFKEQYSYHELVSFYEQHTGLTESGELEEASHAISHYIQNLIEEAKLKGVIRQEIDSSAMTFVFWGMVVGVLQIVETKHKMLHTFLGKSEREFYQYFIDSTLKGLIS